MPPTHPTFADRQYNAHARKLTFVLRDAPMYFANALRRVLLAEVVVSGVPNAYKRKKPMTKHGKPHRLAGGAIIHTNTGRLHNELLLHRLSLLPIGLDASKWQTQPNGESMCLTLRKTCPADAEFVVVTSRDLVLSRVRLRDNDAEEEETDGYTVAPNAQQQTTPTDTHVKTTVADIQPYLLPECTELVPTDPVVAALAAVPPSEQGVLITRLYPDETLDIDLYPDVNCAGNYAGYAPLSTCTYVRDTKRPHTDPTHTFAYTLQGVGTHPCEALVRTGLDVLSRKLACVCALMQPRTVELDFGTRLPALHAMVAPHTVCWVRWANHDYLAMQHEHIHESHVQEVIATTTDDDAPIRADTPFGQDVRVPAVDGEDIPDTPDSVKHVLAMHQPHFADNGVYEYNTGARKYTRSDTSPSPLYIVAKDGRTRCGQVYTPADVVMVHDTRVVLRFSKDIPEHIFDHIKENIDGCVCEGVPTAEDALAAQMDALNVDEAPKTKAAKKQQNAPTVQLYAPHVARKPIEHTDDDTQHVLSVHNEDHTLGNLVQGYVYDWYLRTNKTLTAADKKDAHGLLALGYNQPLPSERRITFRAEFDKPIDRATFVACMVRWMTKVQEVVDEVKGRW